MERRRIQERAHSVKAINPIELIPVSYGRASAQQSRLPPFQFKLAVDSVPVETPKKYACPCSRSEPTLKYFNHIIIESAKIPKPMPEHVSAECGIDSVVCLASL
jgi:hypothetical protein